ncbi:MAG: hypothetical protein R2804_19370 [Cyclobacteriaceae bacterium]
MTPVEKYFNAERWNCVGGIGIGLVAIAFALYYLLKVKEPYYTGMAWSLLVLGLFFLIVCVGVFIRSPKDIVRVTEYVEARSPLLQTEELPRMEKVMKSFRVIMVVEIALMVLSLALIFFAPLSPAWKGAFTGILIMAALLLCFDYLADKRGQVYFDYLKGVVDNSNLSGHATGR